MSLETYRDLWYNSIGPTVWCEIYQHPLHRICPVILNYEKLPVPFCNVVNPNHLGKTGDRIKITPEICYECKHNILNGGMCDPV